MVEENTLHDEGNFDPGILDSEEDIARIKHDLEEKKRKISEMIDGLKPLETDLARRKSLAEAMKQRVDDQATKIESLSRELVEKNRQLQQLSQSNNEMRKQVAEKDGMNKVLKDKLAEKATALKELDAKNRDLEQQVDTAQRQLFGLKNKIGAVESRVFSTDEQNQKLMYEMMNVRQRLKSVEQELARKDSLIAAQNDEQAKAIEALRAQEEDRRMRIMKNHSKKVAIFNATLAALKAQITKQQELIQEKSRKENALMSEFSDRMKELMATRFESSVDVGDFAKEIPTFEDDAPEPVQESAHDDADERGSDDIMNSDDPQSSGMPSRMDEIVPMIELAVDHGDDTDTIKHSLKSSGYSEKDIEEAFSQLHIVEQ